MFSLKSSTISIIRFAIRTNKDNECSSKSSCKILNVFIYFNHCNVLIFLIKHLICFNKFKEITLITVSCDKTSFAESSLKAINFFQKLKDPQLLWMHLYLWSVFWSSSPDELALSLTHSVWSHSYFKFITSLRHTIATFKAGLRS